MNVQTKDKIFGYVYHVWKYLVECQVVDMHYFILKSLINIIHWLWMFIILEFGVLNAKNLLMIVINY